MKFIAKELHRSEAYVGQASLNNSRTMPYVCDMSVGNTSVGEALDYYIHQSVVA